MPEAIPETPTPAPPFTLKYVRDLSADEMRRVCRSGMNIDVTDDESRSQMLVKMQMAGVAIEDRVQVPPDPVAQAREVMMAKAEAAQHVPNETGKTPDQLANERVQIMIDVQEKPGGDQPVPVGVNGTFILIERGKPQVVRRKYLDALTAASKRVYDPLPGPLGGVSEGRDVPEYPVRVLMDPAPQPAATAAA